MTRCINDFTTLAVYQKCQNTSCLDFFGGMNLKILGFESSQSQHLSNQQLPFKNIILDVKKVAIKSSFIRGHRDRCVCVEGEIDL